MPIGGLKETNEQIMAGNVTDCTEAQLLLSLLKYDGGGKYASGTAYCQAILDRFGGLNGLARARPEELTTFLGLGAGMVAIIKAALELGMRVNRGSVDRANLGSPAAVYALLHDMRYLDQEEMRVLSLDTRNCLIRQDTVYRGTLHSTLIRTSELFRPAMAVNANAVVLAHNHPSGDPEPSDADIVTTQAVIAAGRLLDIEVLDHLIIGDGRYVSLKTLQAGFLSVGDDIVVPLGQPRSRRESL